VYRPDKVVLGAAGPVEPFAKTLSAEGAPRVFLCTGASCQPPTSDAATVRAMLKGK
jgi:uncharacterized protein YyaL (SSP411 family)